MSKKGCGILLNLALLAQGGLTLLNLYAQQVWPSAHGPGFPGRK